MRVAVLVSGRGSNLQSLLDAAAASRLGPARLVLVVSDRVGAPALARASAAGVATRVVPFVDFAAREDFDRALVAALAEAGAELVVLAGFLRRLGADFVAAFRGRAVNVHPSLLPAFPGLGAQAQALAAGVRVSGATVHFVDEGLDSGPIVGQRAVTVFDHDSPATLAARILIEEHWLLPRVVCALAEGRVRVEAGRVRVDGGLG